MFKEKDVVYCPNLAFMNALRDYAHSKGVKIYANRVKVDEIYYSDYNSLHFSDTDGISGYSWDSYPRAVNPKYNVLSIEQFIQKCDTYEKKQITEIELTSSYSAVINKNSKTIQVGCQTIPFDKVDELYKLIHS